MYIVYRKCLSEFIIDFKSFHHIVQSVFNKSPINEFTKKNTIYLFQEFINGNTKTFSKLCYTFASSCCNMNMNWTYIPSSNQKLSYICKQLFIIDVVFSKKVI